MTQTVQYFSYSSLLPTSCSWTVLGILFLHLWLNLFKLSPYNWPWAYYKYDKHLLAFKFSNSSHVFSVFSYKTLLWYSAAADAEVLMFSSFNYLHLPVYSGSITWASRPRHFFPINSFLTPHDTLLQQHLAVCQPCLTLFGFNLYH